MLWQVYVSPQASQPDLEAQRVVAEIEHCGLPRPRGACAARGYLIDGTLNRGDIERIARELLTDPVVEQFSIHNGESDSSVPGDFAHVLLKPGVMDPVAQTVQNAIETLGLPRAEVRSFRRYRFDGLGGAEQRERIADQVLANDAIEQVVWGPLHIDRLAQGTAYRLEIMRIPLRTMTDSELERVSRQGQLSLSLTEMRTIQRHFRELGRDPTDAELETLAQTWSEHCSHKTLRGRIEYEERSVDGTVIRREQFGNLLKETIFKATQDIRGALGPQRDWCVSVFEDNAGIVRFDDRFNVCFKVETHNHPSAIEPYGGANTGVGGVIRDVIGTGLGAKPVANTDVFCFAPPDWGRGAGSSGRAAESGVAVAGPLPPGVLHPQRVFKGVVAGVRDYGNRMGIPTVNGAVFFDERYLGNPLVFCGNVGLIPRDCSHKEPKPGDLVVAVGGRTGRDGIHGATFSSAELTHESDALSGGAVQIGNAITEKMMLDVILQARDRRLYHAITDCGAGGFSSAVGEMGAAIGAEVWLEKVPLKYQGLSYTEIWISEAQERMVLAVPEQHWPAFRDLCTQEGVEATAIGRFEPTGRLKLTYEGHVVGDLDMHFLHDGRPPVVRQAVFTHGGRDKDEGRAAAPSRAGTIPAELTVAPFNQPLRDILASWNVCSKEWVIRQYDHEVQGGSVVKPLVGAAQDGPSDAAVIRPVFGSHRGLAIACGMNPRYGDIDPYWMAAGAIDEAIRNCVAVGADPDRIAILDNFCWGNTDRAEELGTLVRAALACRDCATAFGTPFISGKDSLNNEFLLKSEGEPSRGDSEALARPAAAGRRIVIPPTLLISALAQIEDVRQCVTMDLKQPGNAIYLIGQTRPELGGSHYHLVRGLTGGQVPVVDAVAARLSYRRLHAAIERGLIRSCHDLSEGGLAVALAEMAIAGRLGARVELHGEPRTTGTGSRPDTPVDTDRGSEQAWMLFSESHSRLLVEVPAAAELEFAEWMRTTAPDQPGKVAFEYLGRVTAEPVLIIGDRLSHDGSADGTTLVRERIDTLKESWQSPLRW